jgi:hypothetical protein
MIKLTYWKPEYNYDGCDYVMEVVYLKDEDELEFMLECINPEDIFDIEY